MAATICIMLALGPGSLYPHPPTPLYRYGLISHFVCVSTIIEPPAFYPHPTVSVLPHLRLYCRTLYWILPHNCSNTDPTGVSLTENNQIKMNLTNVCVILSLMTAAR